MTTDTREKILSYIATNQQARVHDLVDYLRLSHRAIHRQLKRLVEEGKLQKSGKPPLVFYTIPAVSQVATPQPEISHAIQSAINHNFLSITPDGRLLYGISGFLYWTELYQKTRPIVTVAEEYVKTLNQYETIRTAEGWFDATNKLTTTFPDKYIDHLLYGDIYSYPTFGRTKLAKLVMHAKSAQSKELIDHIATLVKPTIERIIKHYQIDAVGYIPPTVPRPLQFMAELETILKVSLPHLPLAKVLAGDIPVPQKTLSKLSERVINARSTIFLKNVAGTSYQRVLLIDDVTGSGASFQETARKLKALHIGEKSIIAFALVGNIKGYDVIRQM